MGNRSYGQGWRDGVKSANKKNIKTTIFFSILSFLIGFFLTNKNNK